MLHGFSIVFFFLLCTTNSRFRGLSSSLRHAEEFGGGQRKDLAHEISMAPRRDFCQRRRALCPPKRSCHLGLKKGLTGSSIEYPTSRLAAVFFVFLCSSSNPTSNPSRPLMLLSTLESSIPQQPDRQHDPAAVLARFRSPAAVERRTPAVPCPLPFSPRFQARCTKIEATRDVRLPSACTIDKSMDTSFPTDRGICHPKSRR